MAGGFVGVCGSTPNGPAAPVTAPTNLGTSAVDPGKRPQVGLLASAVLGESRSVRARDQPDRGGPGRGETVSYTHLTLPTICSV
eukprot:11668216-Alexandrium_andersonii.AAC.1